MSSNLCKLEFNALSYTGENYMSWKLDATMHLESMDLMKIITTDTSTPQERAKALILVRKHLDDFLKSEYICIKDPKILWKNLAERFDHQRDVLLPAARNEWNSLRFQDFKKVEDYNAALFRIVSRLTYCGEKITEKDMIEKTLSTFHASNIVLQHQYRIMNVSRYHELISKLMVAEKNNEVLMKNHLSRPTGSIAFPEANYVGTSNFGNYNNRGRGGYRGRGRGRGRGHGRGRGINKRFGSHYQWRRHVMPERQFVQQAQPQKGNMNDKGVHENQHKFGAKCYRCGHDGHFARVCRTPEHKC